MDGEKEVAPPPEAPESKEDPDHKGKKYLEQVMSIYCLTRSSFPTLDDYNHYLEEREGILFKLIKNIDVKETKEKMQVYAKAHIDLIEATKLRLQSTPQQQKVIEQCAYLSEELERFAAKIDKRRDAIEKMARNHITAMEFAQIGKQLDHDELSRQLSLQQKGITTTKPVIEPPKLDFASIAPGFVVPTQALPRPIEDYKRPEPTSETKKRAERAGGYSVATHRARALHEAFDGLSK